MPKVMGIDIGTTAIKVIVLETISRDKSRTVAIESMNHDLISLKSGWSEEDALVWRDHLYAILRQLSSEYDLDDLEAIGLTGMVPALLLLDENNEPLRYSIQQNDMRAGAEIRSLAALLEGEGSSYFSRAGSHVNSQHIAPRLMWLERNESDSFNRARTILGSYDWAGYLLTGRLSLEENWALESGLYNINEHRWDEETLSKVKLGSIKLPPVVKSNECIGTITEMASLLTGLKSGIRVYAGTADHVASAYATGARRDGDLVLKLGGAGDILVAMDRLRLEERMYIDYFPSQRASFVMNGCTAASGSLLKWFCREFDGDFKELDSSAERVSAGSDGLVVLPYVLGEKSPIFDPDARGVIYGLMLSHTKAHIYRAFMEAVAYAFRHHVDVIKESGLEINNVYITNGGSTSPLWRQIMSDVLQLPVAYIKTNPGSCLGAAFIAGIASGLFEETVIEDFTSQKLMSYPNRDNKEVYDQRYRTYRALYPALVEIMHEKDS